MSSIISQVGMGGTSGEHICRIFWFLRVNVWDERRVRESEQRLVTKTHKVFVNHMLRGLLLPALLVLLVSACGAQPTTSGSSSPGGDGTGEGTTSSEEG